MSRDLLLYLEDILERIDKIERYVGNMTQEELIQDDKTYEAVVYNLQIIGEASKHIPEEYRQAYSQIEWRKIVALRNIIVHTYFSISNNVIWSIIQTKLGDLEKYVSLMKGEIEEKRRKST